MTAPTITDITSHPDYAAFCEERLSDPYPLYHRLREAEPVHWCEPMKLWLVTRYAEVFAGLRDARFSTSRMGMYTRPLSADVRERIAPLLNHLSKWILLTDEPDHGRLDDAAGPEIVHARGEHEQRFGRLALDAVDGDAPVSARRRGGEPLARQEHQRDQDKVAQRRSGASQRTRAPASSSSSREPNPHSAPMP